MQRDRRNDERGSEAFAGSEHRWCSLTPLKCSDCWTIKVKVWTVTDRRSQVSHLAPSGQWISPGLCPDELFQKPKIQLQCFAPVARKIKTSIKINALQSTYETHMYAIGVCVVMQQHWERRQPLFGPTVLTLVPRAAPSLHSLRVSRV